jgi:tocopherol cyclase
MVGGVKNDKLNVDIENNSFSSEKMVLNLDHIQGEINFSGNIPWPKKWHSTGIMGPFSFVPKMECYHGIEHWV